MTLPCTFNGTTVPSSRITNIIMGGSGGADRYEATVDCMTQDFTVYTALAAMYAPCTATLLLCRKYRVKSEGTCGSLVLNGNTYTYCYIKELSVAEVDRSNLGTWTFTITFVRDTAALL